MSAIPGGRHQDPGRYEIRVKGHLDTRWAAWFDGLAMAHGSDGTTLIHGPVADQAAHRVSRCPLTRISYSPGL